MLILFVSVILEKENKVLLMRRSNTGVHDGKYVFPGGHIDEGETLEEAAKREVLEEVGIGVGVLKLVHVIHINEADDELVGFIFKAENWEGEPRNMEPEKCDQVDWFGFENLPEKTAPYLIQTIQGVRNAQFYSELDWN